MVIFVNPKWDGPEWLRKLILYVYAVLLLAVPIVMVVLALTC